MPRIRRRIESNCCYSLVFRARETLPFSCQKLVKLLTKSAIARTQHNDKVILCHDIWNGSHPHIIMLSKDSAAVVAFHGQIKKRVTDSMKRLLGLKHLTIWEGNNVPAKLGELGDAMDQIAYLYANPAQDNLQDSIELFPGLSSWNEFNRSLDTLGAKTQEWVPWVRMPTVPVLESRVLEPHMDRKLTKLIRRLNKQQERIVREPNAWMRAYGVVDDDRVKEINQEILKLVRAKERIARELRAENNQKVLGSQALLEQPVLMEHEPKKHGNRISIICKNKWLRIALIENYKAFLKACRVCWLRYCDGEYDIEWPPGAFKPPLRPLVNLLNPAFV